MLDQPAGHGQPACGVLRSHKQLGKRCMHLDLEQAQDSRYATTCYDTRPVQRELQPNMAQPNMAQPATSSSSSRFSGANRAALVLVGVLSLLGLAYAIARVDILRARMVVLRTELAETSKQQQQLQAQLEALTNEQREQATHWQAAENTLNHLSSGLTAQISRATDQWTRAEILYLTRLAQDQLAYGHDLHSARSTLAAAVQRATAQPGSISDSLQAQLQVALAALNALPQLQTAVIQQRLQDIDQQLDQLPLASQPTATEPAGTGFWSAISHAARQLVLIRRSGDQASQLVSQQDAQLQREYLSTQLLAARTAAARGDDAAYQAALRNAEAWLGQAFDQANARVKAARQTLTQLKALPVSQSLPDLTATITTLEAALAKGSAA